MCLPLEDNYIFWVLEFHFHVNRYVCYIDQQFSFWCLLNWSAIWFLVSVLGMAYGPNMQNLVYVGMIGIIDPPREGVREAIAMLREGGVSVKMLTGDSEETAKAVGKL